MKRQVEIAEEGETDEGDIICHGVGNNRLHDIQSRQGGYDLSEGGEKAADYDAATNPSREADAAAFLLAQVQQHDDEEKKNHHGSSINKDLDNGDEVGI